MKTSDVHKLLKDLTEVQNRIALRFSSLSMLMAAQDAAVTALGKCLLAHLPDEPESEEPPGEDAGSSN